MDDGLAYKPHCLLPTQRGNWGCRTFKEGLPQGSVLSPLLFVLYINDLLANFCESTMVSAYADDLALACRGRKKEDVAKRMQAEVDKVVSWSQQARLTLNDAKCEVAFFSLDNAKAQWWPQITINGVPPSCTPSPTFLGVTYDRRMTFGTQGQKGVPANSSANQPPSCRGRYNLGLAKARFENSLHCYTTQRRWVCSRGLDTLALVLQHREAWKNPTSSCQGDHPSRPLHANRGCPVWSWPSPARTSV